MRVSRKKNRMPAKGTFRKIARRSRWRWAAGYTYWVEGRTRDGHFTTGAGSTAREAVNDFRKNRAADPGTR